MTQPEVDPLMTGKFYFLPLERPVLGRVYGPLPPKVGGMELNSNVRLYSQQPFENAV
jgi:hypothetical protein